MLECVWSQMWQLCIGFCLHVTGRRVFLHLPRRPLRTSPVPGRSPQTFFKAAMFTFCRTLLFSPRFREELEFVLRFSALFHPLKCGRRDLDC